MLLLWRGINRVSVGAVRYKNPLQLLISRWFKNNFIRVVDRQTGLAFTCLRDADRMFGETFHSKIYDVPLAPVRAGHVVIDVGANHGFASCYFAARGAQVYAFEPNPEVYPLLLRNIETNGLSGRVITSQKALSAQPGSAQMLLTGLLGGGMSTIHKRFAETLDLPVHSRCEVEVITLNQVIQEIGVERIRLLKLDCEGSELDILKSVEPDLINRVDALAIEFHPEAYTPAELFERLLTLPGFHISKALTLEWENANLHAVQERTIREWGAGLSKNP